jgi:hypothetical protein
MWEPGSIKINRYNGAVDRYNAAARVAVKLIVTGARDDRWRECDDVADIKF